MPTLGLYLDVCQPGWEEHAFDRDDVLARIRQRFQRVVLLPGGSLPRILARELARSGHQGDEELAAVLRSAESQARREQPSYQLLIKVDDSLTIEGSVQRSTILFMCSRMPPEAVWKSLQELLASFHRGQIQIREDDPVPRPLGR